MNKTFLASLGIALTLLFVNPRIHAQVAVNSDGSNPNSKAMLDVSSATMGLLIPRMTTVQRNTFEATLTVSEKGMIVFDTDENAIFYFNGTVFEKSSNGVSTLIQDSDGDTKVDVESSTDNDVVTITIDGEPKFIFDSTRIKILNNQNNIAIGVGTLGNNTTGICNVAVGDESLFANTTGATNTAVGYTTLRYNNSGFGNTCVGSMSLTYNTTGANNVATGLFSLWKNTTGNLNSSYGTGALHRNTIGDFNTAVGAHASQENTTGYGNVAVGFNALRSSTVQRKNVAVGDSALFNNGLGYTTVSEFCEKNTAVGSKSLFENTLGWKNTAIGYYSLKNNVSGNENTAVGTLALEGNTTGYQNVAYGNDALKKNTLGLKNTALGSNALCELTEGARNIGIGRSVGYNLVSGERNILIGYNIAAISDDASSTLNIGNYIFGTGFDGNAAVISNGKVGIGIKNPVTHLDVEESMQVVNPSGSAEISLDGSSGLNRTLYKQSGVIKGSIGYSTTDDYLYMYEDGYVVVRNGMLGIADNTPSFSLDIGVNGDGTAAIANSWLSYSDDRFKTDIININNPLERLNKISGYYYFWKDANDKSRQVGVIAQEVEKVLPEIVSTNEEGYKAVDYSKLTPLLIEAVKEQQKHIEMLEQRIEELEK